MVWGGGFSSKGKYSGIGLAGRGLGASWRCQEIVVGV